jgi:hypothetical protein
MRSLRDCFTPKAPAKSQEIPITRAQLAEAWDKYVVHNEGDYRFQQIAKELGFSKVTP